MVALLLLAGGMPTQVASQPVPAGVVTGKSGLQVPRFVSLKADRVNVRVGPGEDYPIAWVFARPGLPIEIVQEYDTWRRVRDSDGSVGWVFQSLLSGARTASVSPWTNGDIVPILTEPSPGSSVAAYLETGVVAAVRRCHAGWCQLSGEGFSGWIEQNQLWGVYPDEEID
jgi:SH3-like domain-containing protein